MCALAAVGDGPDQGRRAYTSPAMLPAISSPFSSAVTATGSPIPWGAVNGRGVHVHDERRKGPAQLEGKTIWSETVSLRRLREKNFTARGTSEASGTLCHSLTLLVARVLRSHHR